jgi:hypothetical protein
MVCVTDQLPYIDELLVQTTAPPERVWTSLITELPRMSAAGRTLARALGCEPASGTPAFTGSPGDTIPGFRVVDAAAGERLMLEGRHRFSRYRLEFLVDDRHLRARTHAAFPGWHGPLYRTAVIRSGAHRLITRSRLHRIARPA